jgi:hypothetical protein
MSDNIPSPFNAPIPGESLTKPPGGARYEKPPKYSSAKDAAEDIWDKITKPKQAAKVVSMLDAGIPAEQIAKTIVFAGFAKGNHTPDLAPPLEEIVTYQVVAIGHRAGVKDMKLLADDAEFKETMGALSSQIGKNKGSAVSTGGAKPTKGAKSSLPKEGKPNASFGGIMGELANASR